LPATTLERDNPATGLPALAALAASLVVGLVLGALTQVGQTWLSDAVRSLANSGAPWVLVAFLLGLPASSARAAGLCGAICLGALELGYVVTAAVRGFPSSSTTVAFWLTAAVLFGPVAGLAGYGVRARLRPWGAVGGGVVSGIVSGEALVSYTTVRDTTSPGYWVGQALLGAVLVTVVGRRAGYMWALVGYLVGAFTLVATRLLPGIG
jgi:hypothetical protein